LLFWTKKRALLVDEAGGVIDEGMRKALKRGWCLGSERFCDSLLERAEKDAAVRAIKGERDQKAHDEQAAD